MSFCLRFISSCGVVILFLAFTSCTSRMRIPTPSLSGRKLNSVESQTLSAKLRTREEHVSAYKTLFRTKIKEPDGAGISLRHAVVVRKPGSIRIETLPLQGAYSLSVFVSLNGQVAVYDAEKDEIQEGELGRKMVKRILGINAEERDLIALLSGSLPPSQFDLTRPSDFEMYIDEQRNEYQFKKGDFLSFARLDATSLALTYLEARSAFSDEVTLQVSFGESMNIEGAIFPKTISLVLPEEKVVVSMNRSALTIVDSIPDAMFRIQ